MSPGKMRAGGGQRITAARAGGTLARSRNLKPQENINLQQRKAGQTTKWGQGGNTRELLKTNARPLNTMGKFQPAPQVYGTDKRKNLAVTRKLVEGVGAEYKGFSSKYSGTIARVRVARDPATGKAAVRNRIEVNTGHGTWNNPRKHAIESRRSGNLSTSDPRGPVFHERGHIKDRNIASSSRMAHDRFSLNQPLNSVKGVTARSLSKRVSKYAGTNDSEFVAEVYAGRRTGRKYDYQVMRAYRELSGRGNKAVRVTRTRRTR
jgi:hypothetical protein